MSGAAKVEVIQVEKLGANGLLVGATVTLTMFGLFFLAQQILHLGRILKEKRGCVSTPMISFGPALIASVLSESAPSRESCLTANALLTSSGLTEA